ncbi:hypothetical protein [Bifidobacterium leontopitheci]|nr:hypothetical protein [Bifidobacterium leontopitheci]
MTVVYGDPCFRDYPPTDFLVSPDGSTAFVFTAGPVLCAVDTASMKPKAVSLSWPLTVPGDDYQPMFTVDGSRLFFSVTYASGTTGIESINVHSLTVKEYPESASRTMVSSPDGKTLYSIEQNTSTAPSDSNATLIAVDAANGSHSSKTTIRMGGQYDQTILSKYIKPLSVSHNARYLYAYSSEEGLLLSIDIATGAGKVVTDVSGMSFSVTRDFRMMFATGTSGRDIKQIQLDAGTAQSVDVGGLAVVRSASDDGSLLQLGDGRPSLHGMGKSVFDVRSKRFISSLATNIAPLPRLSADYVSPDGKLKVTVTTDSGSDGEPWDGLLRLYAGSEGSGKPETERSLDFGRLPMRLRTPMMKFSPDGQSMFFLAMSNDSNTESSGCGAEDGNTFSCASTPSEHDEGVFAKAQVSWLLHRDSSQQNDTVASHPSWGIYVVLFLLAVLISSIATLTIWYKFGGRR